MARARFWPALMGGISISCSILGMVLMCLVARPPASAATPAAIPPPEPTITVGTFEGY
ncbi:MAG: hypothetical protein H0V44_04775 [Planctomycetes bacterium]|nr:hypothetical protein [Planctomycetota bacterium]